MHIYDKMESKFSKLDEEIKKLKNIVREYQAENKVLMDANIDLQNENAKLKEEINYAKKSCEKIKQNALSHNIVVNGLLEQDNEDLMAIGNKVLQTIALETTELTI